MARKRYMKWKIGAYPRTYFLSYCWSFGVCTGIALVTTKVISHNSRGELSLARNLWFLFLSLSFSCSQVVIKKSSYDWYFCSKWRIFHSNDDFFTQTPFLNKKNCHLKTLQQENKSKRKKEPEILRLLQLTIFRFGYSIVKNRNADLTVENWNFKIHP